MAERFRSLVHDRLVPALADIGFGDGLPSALAIAPAHGVLWVLDVSVAPWSSARSLSFSLGWGVHVPGIDEVLGDPSPDAVMLEICQVRGRTGERGAGVDPDWFNLRALPGPLAAWDDTNVANRVFAAVVDDVMPKLRALSTPADVQRRLHEGLVCTRGAPSAAELQTIRRIAALSLLLGDRDNAARWLDFLEARSVTTMDPAVVADRLAPLRRRLAS